MIRLRHLLLLSATLLSGTVAAQNAISLAGQWDMATKDGKYSGKVSLPGSLLTNHIGDDPSVSTQWTGSLYDSSFYFNPKMKKYREPGHVKFPFFLTPEKHYVGRVVYKRKVNVPSSWNGSKTTLFIERPHIETTLRVNGKLVGHEMSLCVPHEYDLTGLLAPGKENEIEVEVYNGIENVCVGQDSHSVTDQTQGNWNGLAGKIELRKGGKSHVIRVIPEDDFKAVHILIDNTPYRIKIGRSPRLWDEHNPYLYTKVIKHKGENVTVRFGLRKVKTVGKDIVLNGKPIFIRGTVENCNFPLTGFPPTDVQSWVKIIKKCKDYGLNMMRFHSYCPPEAAFVAADSLGFYLQPEGPSWPNHGVKLKRGMTIDAYLDSETKRIIDTYGHHPSMIMLAAGNEPAGDWVGWGREWVAKMHDYDTTRIYCVASVGGGWAWDDASDYHVKGGARGLEWDRSMPQSVDNFDDMMLRPRNYKGEKDNDSPILAHEQGQWCAFPDFSEISKYRGVYKADNFVIFRDLLHDNGMADMEKKFLVSSRHLQNLAYKYDIERNLRTAGYSGFQILGLNDYSGQGTALVGPLNVFWEEKADGIQTQEYWRGFCSDIVPLMKLPKFVFTSADTLRAAIDIYNASGRALNYAQILTTLVDERGVELFNSKTTTQRIDEGKSRDKANVQIPLGAVVKKYGVQLPAKLTLRTTTEANGAGGNSWEIWVYDNDLTLEEPAGILVANELNDDALQCLEKGGKVLLLCGGKVEYGDDVKHHFLPVFWNTSWFKMRPPHTTGAYINAEHPVFADFETDDWQNLNWWELTNYTQVVNMGELPRELKPMVQPVDTWHISRKLGMMFEVKVGKGKLLLTTMDLDSDLDHRVVARQLRHSVLRYMKGKNFNPRTSVTIDQLQKLFNENAPAVNMFTKDSPDELKPALK